MLFCLKPSTATEFVKEAVTKVSELLAGHYEIIQPLGDGGFGEAYVAIDTHLPSNPKCVIKRFRPPEKIDARTHEIIQKRFVREAVMLESLSAATTQIPKLYAYFEEAGKFYIVQELIEGKTLTKKVLDEGVFTEEAAKKFLSDILPVIHYVHSKGVIHRDIKPNNIILRDRDTKPVLIDFGAVKEVVTTVLDPYGTPANVSIEIGTKGYAPLEQLGGMPVFASDLYSLALTTIYLLAGEHPAYMVDPATGALQWHKYVPALNPDLVTVLDKAIQPNYRDRYANAKDMLDALAVRESSLATTVLLGDEEVTKTASVALFPVKKDGKHGYIDQTGKVVIDLKFDSADYFNEGLASVLIIREEEWKWGCIDSSGQMVIEPCSLAPVEFSEGLASVTLNNNKEGYIDKSGHIAIASQFWDAGYFSEGLARVKVTDEGKYGYIEKSGQVVIAPQFKNADHFKEGLAVVGMVDEGKYGYINRSGDLIIPPQFNKAHSFNGGLAYVETAGRNGFINKAGEMVINLKNYTSYRFYEGLAAVNLEDEEGYCINGGYINKSGEVIIPFIFTEVNKFSEGLAAVRTSEGKLGYIDKTGKIIIAPQFLRANRFSEGLAAVGYKEKFNWGYIDEKGELVFKPTELRSASGFCDGLASIWFMDCSTGYIDKAGKYVWKSKSS